MNKQCLRLTPHSTYLETLFAYKSQVDAVFKDVLGLNDIHHIAVSYINNAHQLLTLSSTPSLEFNLFSTPLWQFDKTYQAGWYNLCALAPWQSLYTQERYDELYYVKQIKQNYPVGISMAVQSTDYHLIYSLASHEENPEIDERFKNHTADFYKIATYCSNALMPLFIEAS